MRPHLITKVATAIPGNSKRLRTTFASEADARTAAAAEWQRIQRGICTFEMTLALGNPALIPQSPVKVSGFKPQIDDTDWLTVKVTHTISDGGFATRIEAETKSELATTEIDHQKDPDAGITGVTAQWRDKVSKKKGEELAGSRASSKKLSHLYASRQSARRAVKLEWEKIGELREIIKENSDETH